jgi:hypothetical protein
MVLRLSEFQVPGGVSPHARNNQIDIDLRIHSFNIHTVSTITGRNN